jgi:hypothetical protein
MKVDARSLIGWLRTRIEQFDKVGGDDGEPNTTDGSPSRHSRQRAQSPLTTSSNGSRTSSRRSSEPKRRARAPGKRRGIDSETERAEPTDSEDEGPSVDDIGGKTRINPSRSSETADSRTGDTGGKTRVIPSDSEENSSETARSSAAEDTEQTLPAAFEELQKDGNVEIVSSEGSADGDSDD